jgi:hypothetical protein
MSKKLTLSVEEDLIRFAHTYSEQTGISISSIFEQYLQKLRETTMNQNLNPLLKALYGSFKKNPIPSKSDLKKYFHEKNIN